MRGTGKQEVETGDGRRGRATAMRLRLSEADRDQRNDGGREAGGQGRWWQVRTSYYHAPAIRCGGKGTMQ